MEYSPGRSAGDEGRQAVFAYITVQLWRANGKIILEIPISDTAESENDLLDPYLCVFNPKN